MLVRQRDKDCFRSMCSDIPVCVRMSGEYCRKAHESSAVVNDYVRKCSSSSFSSLWGWISGNNISYMVSLKAAQMRVRRRVKRAATLVRRAAPVTLVSLTLWKLMGLYISNKPSSAYHLLLKYIYSQNIQLYYLLIICAEMNYMYNESRECH